MRVTHIVVCLHGFVQVYRNPGSPGEGFRANSAYLGTGRGKKSGEYFGNGFASLFEDEVVLCGDGRLAEGTYQFNFELEFPDRDLPSSIEFERGTISYMITATMTRPTTISPTMTCDRKVYFVERIDISPLFPPKSRTITLEPISRRSRAKTQARKLVDSSDKKSRNTDSANRSGDPPRQSEASSAPSTQADSGTPVSPEPSEISFDSRMSSQEAASQPDSRTKTSPTASEAGRDVTSKASLLNKVITATVESQAGGCLRGDNIPIRINISHTKHVKSLYGVIITLYRQARVDMRPAIPLGPTEKGKGAKFEDYYPKSVTGLGGLSLSGSGASHIFRKDLSQIMVPLMIDPQTLTAEINAKVRVPEEAFPTISTVPGAMISFKYYVEVVLDIQGKLAGQDRNVGSLAGVAGLPGHNLNVEGSDMERSAFTPFGPTIVDTAPVRRDKSVVTCTFEIIIGTRDSERRKGKRRVLESIANPESPQPQTQQQVPEQSHGAQVGADWYSAGIQYDPRFYGQQDSYYYPQGHAAPDRYPPYQDRAYDHPPPPAVPMPQVLDESRMTEKERLQHAEARLLPSQPPGMDGEQADETSEGATAPYLQEESGDVPQGAWRVAAEYPHSASTLAVYVSDSGMGEAEQSLPMPSAPEYEPSQARSSTTAPVASGDDKQEMQRQQLQAGASAPPIDDENAEPSAVVQDNAPSAPILAEADGLLDDVHDSHANAAGTPDLPQYER